MKNRLKKRIHIAVAVLLVLSLILPVGIAAAAEGDTASKTSETVQQILLPKYAHPDIRVRVEYSIRDESCEITFDYAGEKYDIRESDNDISLAMLNNITDEITYQYEEAGDRGNHVEMRMRKK